MAVTKMEYKRHQSFPLRLSPSLRNQAIDFAQREGISLNHLISLAVVEKSSRMMQDADRSISEKAGDPPLPPLPHTLAD